MHIKYVTDKDREREKKKTLKNLKESQKTDIIFNGEHFYDIGGGHDFVFGWFTRYITKSGIEATNYYGGTWMISGEHGGEYELKDAAWTKIDRPEPTKVDWNNVDLTFPVVKKTQASLLADDIVPVVPMAMPLAMPYRKKFVWQNLWNWLKKKIFKN